MPEIDTSFSSRLHYRKMGRGPVAVLLHGFPESGTLWRNVWDTLAQRYTLLIPDLPGAGESSLPGEVSLNQMAESIKQMLDAEQEKKAVIAGHSMGGYTAFAFAALFPSYIQGLTLVHSTPLPDDEEKKKNRKKVIEFVEKGHKTEFLKQMVPGLFAADYPHQHPLKVQEQVDNSLTMSAEAIVNFYRAMMERPDNTQVLKDASFPVQWIIGARDPLIPAIKLIGQTHTASINFVSYYKDCGHMSMVEAPLELQNDINDFLAYCYRNEV